MIPWPILERSYFNLYVIHVSEVSALIIAIYRFKLSDLYWTRYIYFNYFYL